MPRSLRIPEKCRIKHIPSSYCLAFSCFRKKRGRERFLHAALCWSSQRGASRFGYIFSKFLQPLEGVIYSTRLISEGQLFSNILTRTYTFYIRNRDFFEYWNSLFEYIRIRMHSQNAIFRTFTNNIIRIKIVRISIRGSHSSIVFPTPPTMPLESNFWTFLRLQLLLLYTEEARISKKGRMTIL